MATNRKTLGSLAGIGPAEDAFTLTPHLSNEMPANRGFMVNVAGDVVIRAQKGSADVTLTVLAGVIYPISVKFLRVAGTTATGITGFN
jgi:hypothetical protein